MIFKFLLFTVVTDECTERAHLVRLLVFRQFVLGDIRKTLMAVLAHLCLSIKQRWDKYF